MIEILIAAIAFIVISGFVYLFIMAISRLLQFINGEGKANTVKNKFMSGLMFKGVIIGLLSLLALIPLAMISEFVHERTYLYDSVVREISSSWGEEQTISGPVLVIPYRYQTERTVLNPDEKTYRTERDTHTSRLIVLPRELETKLALEHDFLNRSIYKSLVYEANLKGHARFVIDYPEIEGLLDYQLDKAFLAFGISSNKAIKGVSQVTVSQGAKLLGELKSGTNLRELDGIRSGFSHSIALGEEAAFDLNYVVDFRGSQAISLLPFAQQTHIEVQADWPHPSFNGLLPQSREISENDFKASWDISHLTRNYPQVFTEAESQSLYLNEVRANAVLFEPTTHYGKVERSVKYGFLFIILTFIMIYIFEIGQKASLSLIQYFLVASAMSIFYLVLLSLSEHLSFFVSYLISAAVPVVSVSLYIMSALKSPRSGGMVFGVLVGLYFLLYSILQLQDYALLMGTMLLVVVLFILMYVTRHQKSEFVAEGEGETVPSTTKTMTQNKGDG